MSDIPDDIRKAAADMIMPIIFSGNPTVGVDRIARALMAERERAARTVESHNIGCLESDYERNVIAAAIRRGDNPE